MANANNVTTNDLIQHFKEGEPMTTSRLIAEKFGKNHDNVLKKINNLRIRDPETFGAVKIAESSYVNSQNKVQKEYHLSKDAFAFIAMGFTGTKANRWKLLFINAFNTTTEQLFEQHEEHTRMWTESRSKLSASTVAMSDALKEQLDLTGKDSSAWKVYSNEHRLIGKCMTGEFTGLLRERMTTEQILILAKLEMKNMVLIAQGKDYRERKPILMSYAEPLIAKLPDVEKPQAVLLSANKKLVLKLEKIETTGGSS